MLTVYGVKSAFRDKQAQPQSSPIFVVRMHNVKIEKWLYICSSVRTADIRSFFGRLCKPHCEIHTFWHAVLTKAQISLRHLAV